MIERFLRKRNTLHMIKAEWMDGADRIKQGLRERRKSEAETGDHRRGERPMISPLSFQSGHIRSLSVFHPLCTTHGERERERERGRKETAPRSCATAAASAAVAVGLRWSMKEKARPPQEQQQQGQDQKSVFLLSLPGLRHLDYAIAVSSSSSAFAKTTTSVRPSVGPMCTTYTP